MRLATRLAMTTALGLAACTSGDAPPAAPGTPFVVWVLDAPLVLGEAERPIAGAIVAFDPPGGGARVTKTTDMEGRVVFEGDFRAGTANVTVLSEDHVYLTRLEASPETTRARPNRQGKPADDLVLVPPRVDRAVNAATVELRGAIAGKRDGNHMVTLATSGLARLGSTQALEDAYALRAPKDRPFFLLGVESTGLVDAEGVLVENTFVRGFRLDLPARGDDQLLDLDLDPLPTLPAKVVRLGVEGPAVFGPGTRAFASVSSLDSALTVGHFVAATPRGDARFDVDVTMIDTDVGAERLVTEAVLVAPDGARSSRAEPGSLTEGTVLRDFPPPPTVPDPEGSRTVRDPIPLSGFPAGKDLLARLYAGGQLFWILESPPGGLRAASLVVPYRDEIAATDVQVFALRLTALEDRVDLPTRGVVHRKASTSRDVPLRKR